jgi:hypothetical protein
VQIAGVPGGHDFTNRCCGAVVEIWRGPPDFYQGRRVERVAGAVEGVAGLTLEKP